MPKVSKIKVSTNLREDIRRAVDEIGGLNKFINMGDRVLLKPNFNTADPFPASSDPKFLKEVISLVYDQKPKKVILGDSSTFRLSATKVMKKLHIYDFKNEFPELELIDFNDHSWVKKQVPDGKYLKSVSVPEILDQVDKLILLPCLKTHFIAKFTGALKLSVGLMKPSERMRLHIRKVQEKIAELNTVIHPALVIMDGRKCFVAGGPSSGKLEEPNLILASTSRVAIDIEGIKIIQRYEGNSLAKIKAEELAQISRSSELE